jgi:hypothetical protein
MKKFVMVAAILTVPNLTGCVAAVPYMVMQAAAVGAGTMAGNKLSEKKETPASGETIAVPATGAVATPKAQAGGFDVAALLGGTGASGGGFSQAAVQLGQYSVVAMASSLQAVAKVHEATGDKSVALLLLAQADEIRKMKEPKASAMEKSLKAIEDHPIKRENLDKVTNADDKKKIVESLAYLGVSAIYNAKAVSTAQSLSQMTPGPMDAFNAPALFEVAKTVLTSFPHQITTLAEYTSEISTYANTNKLAQPTQEDSRRIAVENGADPASLADLKSL